ESCSELSVESGAALVRRLHHNHRARDAAREDQSAPDFASAGGIAGTPSRASLVRQVTARHVEHFGSAPAVERRASRMIARSLSPTGVSRITDSSWRMSSAASPFGGA